MSWNVEYRYAALELQEIKSPEELHLLLQSFASSILQEYRETANTPDCMEDVVWDIAHGEFSSDDEIIKAITQIASLYLDEIEHTEDGATLRKLWATRVSAAAESTNPPKSAFLS